MARPHHHPALHEQAGGRGVVRGHAELVVPHLPRLGQERDALERDARIVDSASRDLQQLRDRIHRQHPTRRGLAEDFLEEHAGPASEVHERGQPQLTHEVRHHARFNHRGCTREGLDPPSLRLLPDDGCRGGQAGFGTLPDFHHDPSPAAGGGDADRSPERSHACAARRPSSTSRSVSSGVKSRAERHATPRAPTTPARSLKIGTTMAPSMPVARAPGRTSPLVSC